jgi:hypothetical protein
MKTALYLLLLLLPVQLFAQTDADKTFSPQQIKEDLAFFSRTIKNVHPDPWHAVSKEKFKWLSDSITASLKENTTLPEAWAGFSLLMASFDEGHSTIAFPASIQKRIREGNTPLFPVLLKEYNGESLVVRYDLSKDSVLKTGDLITHINGQPATELMRFLTSFYGGLPAWRNTQVLRDFAGQLKYEKEAP